MMTAPGLNSSSAIVVNFSNDGFTVAQAPFAPAPRLRLQSTFEKCAKFAGSVFLPKAAEAQSTYTCLGATGAAALKVFQFGAFAYAMFNGGYAICMIPGNTLACSFLTARYGFNATVSTIAAIKCWKARYESTQAPIPSSGRQTVSRAYVQGIFSGGQAPIRLSDIDLARQGWVNALPPVRTPDNSTVTPGSVINVHQPTEPASAGSASRSNQKSGGYSPDAAQDSILGRTGNLNAT
jgi:hypothetical protein